MNQSEIVARTASITGLPKTAVDHVIKTAADVITAALRDGDDATLPGLGKLVTSRKEARIGRNPMTGSAHPIPARNVVKFRVAKALKEAVAG